MEPLHSAQVTDHFAGLVASHVFTLLIPGDNAALLIEGYHQHWHMLDDSSKPLFAFAQRLLRTLEFPTFLGLAQGAADGRDKSRRPVFEHVIGSATLHA